MSRQHEGNPEALAVNRSKATIAHGKKLLLLATLALVALSVAGFQRSSPAANGTWSQTSGGNWDDQTTGPWTGGVVAGGAGFTADFSTQNITADQTITLDASRTIGTMLFGDATTASNNWTLANSGGAILTLDNTGGTGQPKIIVNNQTLTITGTLAGTNGVSLGTTGATGGGNASLVLNANSYNGSSLAASAFTTLIGNGNGLLNVFANDNTAFGIGSINLGAGGARGRIELNSGVTISNNITLSTINIVAGGNGALQTNGDVPATFAGQITFNVKNNTGGGVYGAPEATFNPAGNYLTFTGPLGLGPTIAATTAKTETGGSTSNAQVFRGGNIRLSGGGFVPSGGGSVFRIEQRCGVLQVGANNGVPTTAYIDLGGNSDSNPQPFAVLDLNGFNQSLVGISNYVQGGGVAGSNGGRPGTVTNSSTATASTLTLSPVAQSNANLRDLVFSSGADGTNASLASISDASPLFPTSLTVNGAADGEQYMTTPANSYRGVTTLTSGVLAVSSLANGGANSSIGASSNAAANVVFNGGTLRYVNQSLQANETVQALGNTTNASTDRNFTIANASTGTIDVASAGTTVTFTGGSAATTGQLIVNGNPIASVGSPTGAGGLGQGTLILAGTNLHTGGTTVSSGTLLVNGSLASGTVSVASGATLGGTGTIGGTVLPASGGFIAPGNPAVASGIGTLTVGALTLNSGTDVVYQFGTGNDIINVSSPGGLTLNSGSSIDVFDTSGNQYTTNGVYTLFNYSGALGGSLGNLGVNSIVPQKKYVLGNTGTAIQLTISDAAVKDWTNSSGDTFWATTSPTNFTGGVPNSVGDIAQFGTSNSSGAGTVVITGGNKTVSDVIIDNIVLNYNISGQNPATDTLTLDNGANAAVVSVANGQHTISANLLLNSKTFFSTGNSTAAITVGGTISNAQPITFIGAGTATLTGASNGSTTTTVKFGTLNVGNGGAGGSLGSGAVSLISGATLNFNRNNAYVFNGAIAGSGTGAITINQVGTGISSSTSLGGALSGITTINVPSGALTTGSTANVANAINVTANGGLGNTGSGSYTAGGVISGTGALNIDTTGIVTLNAANTYTGGTTINSGTLVAGINNAIAASGGLGINGGTVDLNGKSVTLNNIFGNGSTTGVITNNSTTQATLAFSGNNNSYNIYAAINDGAATKKVAVTTTIANAQSGNIRVLEFHNGSSTYSGGTTVTGQNIQADVSGAFGTGTITVNSTGSSTNSTQVFLMPGVSIGNSIDVKAANPHQTNINGARGVIQQTGPSGDTTISGPITVETNINGITDGPNTFVTGLFFGPAVAGADFMNVTGAITVTGTGVNTVAQAGGQVKYSGGGTYTFMQISGLAQLAANNGLSQTAQFAINNASTLELNGFNQTGVGLGLPVGVTATNGTTSAVQNSTVTTSALTLNTAATTTYTYNGTINNSGGNINLTVQGSGFQQLTNAASSYVGITTISGTAVLQATSLADGLNTSSIGAASNDPANLVFDGGTLQYTGTNSASTDRGFTINSGKTAVFSVKTLPVNNVSPPETNLTLRGTSPASNGSLTKTGAGTLTFDPAASFGYTGATTVGAGTLVVNNALSTPTSISIASGAKLTGGGSISGTLTHTTGIINPGDPAAINGIGPLTFTGAVTLNGGTVQYDLDGSNITGAQDVVNANGGLSIAGASTIDLEFASLASVPASSFDLRLFNYTGTLVDSSQYSKLSFISNGLAGRSAYTPSSTATQVNLNVVPKPAANINWNSAAPGSGVWDVASSTDGTLGTANWFNTGVGATNPDKFYSQDNVTFPDNGVGPQLQTAITLAAGVNAIIGSANFTSNTNNYTISGAGSISGPGTLNKTGSSLLTIQTNNSYTGGTMITGGTVNVGGNTASGSLGTGTITNNAALIFQRTGTVTVPNTIGGSGNLTLTFGGTASVTGPINQAALTSNGTGTTTLSGAVVTTGAVAVSAGSVSFTGGLTFGSAGLSVSGSAAVTSPGGINGTGGISTTSTGTVNVSGTNSYDGNTVVSAGTFFAGSATAFGSTVGSTTVNPGGSINSGANNVTLTFAGESLTINGSGTSNNGAVHSTGNPAFITFDTMVTVGSSSLVNMDGGSTLAFTGATAMTGSNVTVTANGNGTFAIGGNVNLGATGSINTGTSGTLSFIPPASGTITISNPIVSGTSAGNIQARTAGTPAQGSLGTTILSDNPSYTGSLTVDTGNLEITTANGLGTSAGTITINGSGQVNNVVGSFLIATAGTVSINKNFIISARQGPGIDVPDIENVSGNNTLTGTVTLQTGGTDYNFQSDAGSLAIQANMSTSALGTARNLKLTGAGNGSLNGLISDTSTAPINLSKSGAGTWTLNNTNGIRGNTTIGGGTLLLGVNYAIGGTDTPLAPANLMLGNGTSGGTLASGGHSNTFNQLTLNNNSTLDFGNGTSILRFANSNSGLTSVVWAPSTTLQVSNWTYGTDRFQVGTDTTGLAGSQLSQINFDHFAETGATMRTIGGFGEVLPNAVGDVNQDGVRDVADVSAAMTGLSNIQAYQAVLAGAHPGFTLSDTKFVLDVNVDGSPNNLDIQAEMVGLANGGSFSPGGGSLTAVPEPSAFILLVIGATLIGFTKTPSRIHRCLQANCLRA
jgi:fibronectin-binding autotransporter adhesin